MILIDSPNVDGWCHLVANTIPELHAFAERIGVKKCWFENKRGKNQPHYDIRKEMIEIVQQAGGKKVSNAELFLFLEKNYGTKTKQTNILWK
jgi:hypothetical protein